MKWDIVKRVYDKISLGVLRIELLGICGVIAVCLVKTGGLFLA